LHAPKKTNRRRDSELEIILEAGLPLHVIQGDKDGFGTPAEFNGVDVTVVPGRGHELLRSRDDEHAAIVKAAARDFATRVLSL
jgi:pimeloyl-ACP methyl ester carboxylesterase